MLATMRDKNFSENIRYPIPDCRCPVLYGYTVYCTDNVLLERTVRGTNRMRLQKRCLRFGRETVKIKKTKTLNPPSSTYGFSCKKNSSAKTKSCNQEVKSRNEAYNK